jgi:lipopolysaccharide export system permease protein
MMLRLPWTLSSYIARHFLLSILLALFGLMVLAVLIDVIELLRRASGRENIPIGIILQMALLNIPALTQKFVPYAVLIGSMLALTRLTRTHELVVARAAGISVWQFLAPAMGVVLALGLFMTTVFGPFAAVLLMKHEQVEARYFSGRVSLLSISNSGLWLRQIEEHGERIIYAKSVDSSDMTFQQVIVFNFGEPHAFTERLDANTATLESGQLRLRGVTRSLPGRPPEIIKQQIIPTSLTVGNIQDSFASPESLSFWALPGFIDMLENSGFSALKHRLYWQIMLSSPFLLMGMVLVAAVFSLRLPRRGKIGL